MRVITSQLAGGDNNADRVLVTDNAVLVLDGATAFEPVSVDPGVYAETLGQAVAKRLSNAPDSPLSDAVAEGISTTVRRLSLRPDRSPSSTISIVRFRGDRMDLYVLGDSPIYYGTDSTTRMLTDNRLSNLGKTHLATLIDELRAHHGYSEEHRQALAVLQRAQRQQRNTPDGYWIAETDPAAAYQAEMVTVNPYDSDWILVGTDGATNHIAATEPENWPVIARYDSPQLDALLESIHGWERDIDPHGIHRPRAKRHDDKTLAAIQRFWPDEHGR